MQKTHQENSMPLDLCWLCRMEILDRDRFCRHCGSNLNEQTTLIIRAQARDTGKTLSPYATAPLEASSWNRPISEKLVGIVLSGVMNNAADLEYSRFTRKLILVLISPPIWLMMILLSPLDAYAASKAIARQL